MTIVNRKRFKIQRKDARVQRRNELLDKVLWIWQSTASNITNNMLWGGRVVTHDTEVGAQGRDEREQWLHKTTVGVKELTRLLYSSPDVFTTIIPLRDGVSVTVKR